MEHCKSAFLVHLEPARVISTTRRLYPLPPLHGQKLHLINQLINFRSQQRLVPPAIDPEVRQVFVKEIQAHSECIVSLTKIELAIGGLVTCSIDQKVKLWSSDLDQWGTVSDVSTDKADSKWCFPTQAKDAKKETEISQVQTLLQGVSDQIDPDMKLMIADEKAIELENSYPNFQERLQKSMRKRIQTKANQIDEGKQFKGINLADLIDQYNNRLSNDTMHEKTIKNLDKKIKDIDKNVAKMKEEETKHIKKQYHGFPKYLENGFAKQSQSSQKFDFIDHQHTQEAMANAIVQEEDENPSDLMATQGIQELKLLLRNRSNANESSNERRERVLLRQIEQSRSNSKSRISETLERDRSSLILLKNAPKIRDQLISCNQQRSKRLFATPHKSRHFNLSSLDRNEVEDDGFQMFTATANQTSNRTLLPSIMLNNKSISRLQETSLDYPSSIQLHEASYITLNLPSNRANSNLKSRNSSKLDYRSYRETPSQNNLAMNIQSNYGSKLSLLNHSKQSEDYLIKRKNLQFQQSEGLGVSVRRRKSQFITRNTEDAVHIVTDKVIREQQTENGNFQRLKEKYFGEKSAVRLLVKEESSKLRDQKKYIREALPLREIIEKMRKEELRQQRQYKEYDHY